MLVSFLAYVVKATTGFGTAIIIVSIGSLLIGTYEAVILTALIDTAGGTILYIRDPVKDNRSYWIPLAVAMIIGSVAGALILKAIPVRRFDILLGVVIAVLGFWFILGRGADGESCLEQELPSQCSGSDLAVSAFSGLCGGLFAVGGPPIVYWLGRRFAKHAFRRALIVVFFLATIARVITYGASGLLNVKLAVYALYSLPGVVLGIVLGNRIFIALSERWFSRVVGVLLIIVSLKLLFLR
ncbi:sulfite exporter TauE/SafE family protein [bacterium]|nr:sulfite exporter TauE/SafE family protein [bacterium]